MKEVEEASKSAALKLLFVICGLSVFARSESVFMQTQMYSKCFGLGDRFYALASCAMFMPGILVQIMQHSVDPYQDRKYGTRRASSYRLVIAVLGSLAALIGLILGSFENMSLEDSPAFIYLLLAILGIGISISFGSFVQIVTMFPPDLHPFFFIGTYSPFLIFAPINVAVKDLCVKEDEEWRTRWHSVIVYYFLAVFLTLAGLMCYFGIAKHPLGKLFFSRKDLELRAAQAAFDPDTDVDYEFRNGGERRGLLNSSSVNSAFASKHITNWEMVRLCWKEIATQLIMTVCSTLVASLYIKFNPTTYDDLPTLLQYDYYICGAIGIFITSFGRIRKYLTSNVLLIVCIIRLAVVPLAIVYAQDLLPRSDAAVLVVNSLQMFVGGAAFSLCFSNASSQFTAKPDRTKASTVMNICYYLAMAVALGISLALT
eukprot:m.206408 g.206408  ORF g.206408 m.206408 type:complete len:429 (-) comp16907_c1_seq2:242-1528(-)